MVLKKLPFIGYRNRPVFVYPILRVGVQQMSNIRKHFLPGISQALIQMKTCWTSVGLNDLIFYMQKVREVLFETVRYNSMNRAGVLSKKHT